MSNRVLKDFIYVKRFDGETKTVYNALMYFDGREWHDFPDPSEATWDSREDKEAFEAHLEKERRKAQSEEAKHSRWR